MYDSNAKASDAAAFIPGHALVVDAGATAGPKASAPRVGQNRKVRFAGPSFERAGGKVD